MNKITEKFIAWVKLARLQFYPMAWIAYSIGTACAYRIDHKFSLTIYLIGYICLFLIELGTVFCNEYFDLAADKINKNSGIFSGGSRVLVNGKIKIKEIKTGILIVICLIFIFGSLLLYLSKTVSAFSILFLLLAGIFLGTGYTVPPLKFCYRGLGEFIVAITFSFYLILCGYIFQTDKWNNSLPWLLSIPLFFSIFPAIILAGIPDYKADRAVSKKSLPVILGPGKAILISICFNIIAAISGILLWYLKIISGITGIAIFIVIPHALILGLASFKLIKTNNYDRRIDKIIILALFYILWFGLIPLIYLTYGYKL